MALLEREMKVPARLQAVNSIRLYYLTNLAEDPQKGSDWDLHVLDALDSLDVLAIPRGREEYENYYETCNVEEVFG